MQQKNTGKILCALLSCMLMLTPAIQASAAGTVTYGSESYRWYTEQISPIGVYLNSDTPVASYEICLEFDTAMLRYLDGATEQTDNLLYIRGSGEAASYKHMLHFEPLQTGDTAIRVVSATAAALETAEVSAGDAQPVNPAIEITMLSSAPVTIEQSISNRLSGIAVEGVALEGFSPDVHEYSIETTAETERISVTYTAEDAGADVTLSDTSLVFGENIINLYVTGNGYEQGVYTLHVMRPEPVMETPVPVPEATPEPEPAPTPVPKAENLPEAASAAELLEEPAENGSPAGGITAERIADRLKKAPFLWMGVALVTVLLALYLIRLVRKRKRRIAAEAGGKEDNTLKVINLEQTVINVSHVSMRFKLAQDEASSLKEYFIRTVKHQNHYRYLMALKDISFEVKQGDVVGIIGTNGSGKSTLLKIISGALNPTEGHVDADRSKIQMLTLGTGFDMELTARENVYLNGAIIGYTREYINEKYEDIVAFAELEGFMEERMKNFSSGMVSRLGFAIATMRDTPDILILDEVLSVGDMFFRQKSLNRVKEMIHSGATVLIVSHSPDVILNNCSKAVWIEKGILQMVGRPEEVCEAYSKYEVQEQIPEDMEEKLEEWEEDVEDIENTED